jgi:hypothetical protein
MKTTVRLVLFILINGFLMGCFKEDDTSKPETSLPTLTTKSITNILATSAISGGNITSDGNSIITARGIVWDTNPNPTVELTTKTTDGSGTGNFTSNLTELIENTTNKNAQPPTHSIRHSGLFSLILCFVKKNCYK